jgi:hypothetical protein
MLVLIWIHVHWLLCATALVARRYQMISIGCCARAASGHAAPPPSSVMNSRRFTARSSRASDRKIAQVAALPDSDPAMTAVGLSVLEDVGTRWRIPLNS